MKRLFFQTFWVNKTFFDKALQKLSQVPNEIGLVKVLQPKPKMDFHKPNMKIPMKDLAILPRDFRWFLSHESI